MNARDRSDAHPPDADPAISSRRDAERALTRRYLVLHGLRWLPTGLVIPIIVLLFTQRGYSLAEYGVIGTIMALTTFTLELPTGGLADALGRRRVLLVGVGFVFLSTAIMVTIAWSPDRPPSAIAAAAMIATGIFRALESGPLDAWFVDAVHAIDPAADVEAGLGRAGTVTGFSIAAGSLLAGGVLAWDPIHAVDPMAIVLLGSLTLITVQGIAIACLMQDPRPPLGVAALRRAVRDVPGVVGSTISLAHRNRVVALLLAVEATWSIGMVAFENLFPVHLVEVTGSADDAAALMGPTSAAAWAASGIGAGLVVRLSRRIGPYRAAALLRVIQAATIVAMGLAAGALGAIAALVATYLVHGASAPVQYALLHRQVDAARRATVLSLNSMVAFASFSVAAIAIGAVADEWSVAGAISVCAGVTVLGGLFPLRARRHDPDPFGPMSLLVPSADSRDGRDRMNVG